MINSFVSRTFKLNLWLVYYDTGLGLYQTVRVHDYPTGHKASRYIVKEFDSYLDAIRICNFRNKRLQVQQVV